MSYILDALRRADAERERGAVPDLHAQPVPPGSGAAASGARGRPWRWIAVGLTVGLLGPLLWQLFGRDAPADAPVAAPEAPVAAPATAPTAVATAPPGVAAVAPPAPSPVPGAVLPIPPLRPVAPAPAPPPATVAAREPLAAARKPAAPAPQATREPAADARRASPPVTPATSAATSPPVSSATPAAPVTPAPASAAPEGRIHAINELPDEIRRQLPTIAVGGSIYSENAANRFLIINGQIFHEKDKLGAELVLEQIKLKAAVLRFKGYRYEITY